MPGGADSCPLAKAGRQGKPMGMAKWSRRGPGRRLSRRRALAGAWVVAALVPVGPPVLGLRATGYAAQPAPGAGSGYPVRLEWDGDPGEEYFVFRADNHISRGLTNPLVIRTPQPIAARVYEDAVPRPGLYIYQVRAVRGEIESPPAEIWVTVGPRSPRNLRVQVEAQV